MAKMATSELDDAEQRISARISNRAWLAYFFPNEERGFGPFFFLLYGTNWHRISGYEVVARSSEHKSMAHLMHSIGAFPSVADARRNGYNTPVTRGLRFVRIRGHKHRLVIE